MTLNRYEHQQIKNLIDGYMVGTRPLETREQEFERAKTELLGHLERQIDQVKQFAYSDMGKKVS
ncbi:hypothetical protein [Pseudomonas sp. GM_Psu_2]|uniref:hypothetical protein n=1 Tax=unclassified Pseudomonas TaxID=196821 RepID=UPI002269AD10|nr:hypothetical protein [Pseudomonas sp. GM_Psu_2]